MPPRRRGPRTCSPHSIESLPRNTCESARRAWAWVESHSRIQRRALQKVLSFDKSLPERLRDKRAMAAVELLAATRRRVF